MENLESNYSTCEIADPKSYCIQDTLQDVIQDRDIDNQLMFSGSNGFKFAADPLFTKGYIPTIKELIERLMKGK
jgi:hypothetical protein